MSSDASSAQDSSPVQPKTFVVPTVTDAQLAEVHLGLRKCSTPAAPVVLRRVSGVLQ